ncbi:MAG TPA: phosphatidylglycerophosphatase A [Bryobacteraceae bacterium]|nr:phosphatidylglycerophosphatase A [Bryobacteraceae bacterium]
MKRAAIVLATWFGCGYFPWGPGTAGSVAAVAIAAALHRYAQAGRMTLLLLVAVLVVPAAWAAGEAARAMQDDDPKQVVVDEVVGQWVTLLGASALSWRSFALGLVLFRLFDIWKPWPVRNFEKLPGGVGIVADDLAAGVYGALILYVGGALRLY